MDHDHGPPGCSQPAQECENITIATTENKGTGHRGCYRRKRLIIFYGDSFVSIGCVFDQRVSFAVVPCCRHGEGQPETKMAGKCHVFSG